jgi:hypothetical protein
MVYNGARLSGDTQEMEISQGGSQLGRKASPTIKLRIYKAAKEAAFSIHPLLGLARNLEA